MADEAYADYADVAILTSDSVFGLPIRDIRVIRGRLS